jgi:hypothetical protein
MDSLNGLHLGIYKMEDENKKEAAMCITIGMTQLNEDVLLKGTRIKSVLRVGFNGNTATKIPFMYSFSGNCAASAPNFHIHVSVSDLYIPRIGPHIFGCIKIDRPILEIYKSLTDMSVGTGRQKNTTLF